MATTPVVQVSKIQLRRGVQADLPGATSSGLDAAEMAFATDTGRLFIGINQDQQTPTTGRTAFPYENIEVLTENSPCLGQIFDELSKNMTNSYYSSSPLIGSDSLVATTTAAISTTVAPSYTFVLPMTPTSGVSVNSLVIGNGIPYNTVVTGFTSNSITCIIDQQKWPTDPNNIGGSVVVPEGTTITFYNEVWQTVHIPATTAPVVPFFIGSAGQSVCARIVYFLMDNSNAMRTGTMSVMYNGGASEPFLFDENAGYPILGMSYLDLSNDPSLGVTGIQFRAAMIPDGVSSRVCLQYRNSTADTPILMFRIEQPIPLM